MSIKTDYVGGDVYNADDHNDENLQILENKNSMMISGKKIDLEIFGITSLSDLDLYPIYSDDGNALAIIENQGDYITFIDWENGVWSRDADLDWVSLAEIRGTAIMGDYIYFLFTSSSEQRLYRFEKADFESGGNQVTASFLGSVELDNFSQMTSDGTDLFLTNKAGGQRFGDDATQIDVIDQGLGVFRYSYDGTGTAPLFVTNGLAVGDWIEINGFTNPLNNNGLFEVIGVTETYFFVGNPVGPELVTNGDFSSSTGWTFGLGWSYDGGSNHADLAFSATLGELQGTMVNTEADTAYTVSYDVLNFVSQNVRVELAGSNGQYRTANGSYSENLYSAGSVSTVGFSTQFSASELSIDNVSVKHAGGQPTTNATGIKIIKAKNVITRASISGLTATKEEDIVCDNGIVDSFDNLRPFAVDSQFIYGYNINESKFYKFNKTTGVKISELYIDRSTLNELNILNKKGELLLFDQDFNFQTMINF